MVNQQPLIAVVDDEPMVLKSIARLLQLQGFAVKPYSSPQRLLDEIDSCEPGCIVADLSMPELSGLDLQRTLAEFSERYPIVFLTGHGDIRSSVTAMRAGAVDFLTKPFEQAELLDAIERALRRSRHARELIHRLDGMRDRIESLTQRERQVFEEVVTGYLNKQIAAHLGISEKTVKVHRARVMRKMSVRSVAQLARLAEQIGIPSP
ncbi:MAG TPA: response regulator [Gammaproteobacteria bacterium]|nr:response regulator [Gammaproteobacteria bacterium]